MKNIMQNFQILPTITICNFAKKTRRTNWRRLLLLLSF